MQQNDAVFFFTAAPLNGGGQDFALLSSAIGLTISAAQHLGPVIARLVRGQLSLDDALEALRRAEGGGGRGRGVA
jgi:hypothetical protein